VAAGAGVFRSSWGNSGCGDRGRCGRTVVDTASGEDMNGERQPRLITVAHRGGNRLVDLRAALASGVDLVEADVHLVGGVLEVRRGVFAATRQGMRHQRGAGGALTLDEVLSAASSGPGVLLDLKGPSLRVAAKVAALLREQFPGLPVAVCTKQWRMFDAFAAA